MTPGPAARSQFVQSGSVRLHVAQHGAEGPDLLVVPGITSPAAVWGFVAEPLARARRVHVLDLRGRGLSDVPDTGYALADYAADAAAAIEGLGLDRPAVLGHSLGARIAAELALARPGLIGALILADPPLTGPGRPRYPLPLSFYLDGIRQARDGLSLEEARALEPGWDDERVLDRARWLGTCDERAITETYHHFHDEDFLGRWERLDAPVLVHGGRSPVVTADGVEELRLRNPTARVVAVPGAGHMIPWDDRDGFVDVVDHILA